MRLLVSVMLNGLCAAALAGCGGGGDSAFQTGQGAGLAIVPVPTPASPSTSAPSPASAPAPTPTPKPAPVDLNVVRVESLPALVAALDQAKPGAEIRLAGGKYGNLNLKTREFPRDVTVAGEPGQVAAFETVTLDGVKNLKLRNLTIGRPMAEGEAAWVRFANVTNSSNIALDRIQFQGSMDSNPQNDGRGLMVRFSKDISVTNSTFQQLNTGFEIGDCERVVASGNVFHDLRNDGMNFSAVAGVTVNGNFFTDFYPLIKADGTGDHPDAIQFFTAGAKKASQDIVITSNVVLQGNGGGSQGIFLTDQIGGLPFRNVRIDNNLIYVRGWNGIMVGGGVNVSINNNTTISPTDDALFLRIRLQNIEGISLTNNVVDEFVFEIAPPALVNSLELRYNAAARSQIPNLNAGKIAKVADLVYPTSGYRPAI